MRGSLGTRIGAIVVYVALGLLWLFLSNGLRYGGSWPPVLLLVGFAVVLILSSLFGREDRRDRRARMVSDPGKAKADATRATQGSQDLAAACVVLALWTGDDRWWIGAAAGAGCFFAATTMKRAFGYDDSLDAFGVHAVGGIIGALLTGVFALKEICGTSGALEGNPGQVLIQIEGIAATLIWTAVATFVILIVVNMVTGVRVSQAVEVEGLDINLHGEVVQ